MGVFEAVLWGAMQGLTEFLPVSSSGHLVLVPWLTGNEPVGFTYNVLVHFATLFAVLIYFHAELGELLLGVRDIVTRRNEYPVQSRLVWLIAISSIPAALAGLLLGALFQRLFASPPVAAALLLVTGTVMFAAEHRARLKREMHDLGVRDALAIGIAQSFALAPGISRSGVTISAGLASGFGRDQAARYSFLMAIPAIAGATLLEVIVLANGGGDGGPWLVLAAGSVAAFVSGYLGISLLLKQLRRRGLRVYSYYCWAMGLFSLYVFLVR